jgi:hypothetical protein
MRSTGGCRLAILSTPAEWVRSDRIFVLAHLGRRFWSAARTCRSAGVCAVLRGTFAMFAVQRSAQHAAARPEYLCIAVRTLRCELMPRGVRAAQAQGKITPAGLGIIEAYEQVIFPPLSCDRYPAAGHPLPDLPAHRGVPARQPQRGPDRALPPCPSRSARRPFPVAFRRLTALPCGYRHRRRLSRTTLRELGRRAPAVTECGHPS